MDNLEIICGSKPSDYIQEIIGNDPNYIFEADPDFSPIQIYNKEGRAITVNSYIECEHYFSGGWTFSSNSGYELSLQSSLLFFVILIYSFQIVYKKFFRSV